jgi:hypothetical protein
VDDLLERLRRFQTTVSPLAAAPVVAAAKPPPELRLSTLEASVRDRLRDLSPDLATSFEQAFRDLQDDDRATYVGPAGELREVFRATIHLLALDSDVAAQKWFKGDDRGKPTQAERIRYIAQEGGIRDEEAEDQVKNADEFIDLKLGSLGRATYRRANRALHAGTRPKEVRSIANFVVAVLDEVLPV